MPIKDDCTPTSDDWKPGDLALCVKGGQIDMSSVPLPAYPKQGAIYTVDDASMHNFRHDNTRHCLLALSLRDGPENLHGPFWPAFRFRKIQPLLLLSVARSTAKEISYVS